MSARILIERGDGVPRVIAAVLAHIRMGTPVVVMSDVREAVVRVTPAPCACCAAVLVDGHPQVTGIVPAVFTVVDPWDDDIELLDGTPAAPPVLLPATTAATTAVRWLSGIPTGAHATVLRDDDDLPHIDEA